MDFEVMIIIGINSVLFKFVIKDDLVLVVGWKVNLIVVNLYWMLEVE